MRRYITSIACLAIASACDSTAPVPRFASITLSSPANLVLVNPPDTTVRLRGTAAAPQPIQRIWYRYARFHTTGQTIFDDATSQATRIDFSADIPTSFGEDTLILVAEWQAHGSTAADTARVVVRQRQPLAVSLMQPVPDTLDQRGFGVLLNVNLSVAQPQLVFDPGTPAEVVVKDFAYSTQYTGATALPNGGGLMEVPDTLTRGSHRFVVRTYDAFGLRPDSIVGSFVAKLDQVAYHVVPLQGLGGPDAGATRLNDAGVAVGWARSPDSVSHAIVWRSAAATVLPPDSAVAAWDINEKGQIVGCTSMPVQSTPSFSYQVAVLWTGDVPQLLTQPFVCNSAYEFPRMNDSGAIVFSSTTHQYSPQTRFLSTSTIRWPDGSAAAVPISGTYAINNGGEVVGYVAPLDENHGHAISASWPATLPVEGRHGGYYYSDSYFIDINDANQAIGSYHSNATELFLSSGGTVRDLTWDLGTATKAPALIAINSRGVVLAFDPVSHGVLLWNGHTTAVTLDDPTWQIDGVTALNANGWITAHAKDPATGRGTALLLVPKQ